jgi:hypothetical protein
VDNKGKAALDAATTLSKRWLQRLLRERDDAARSEAARRYRRAVPQFNESPKKGVAWAVNEKVVSCPLSYDVLLICSYCWLDYCIEQAERYRRISSHCRRSQQSRGWRVYRRQIGGAERYSRGLHATIRFQWYFAKSMVVLFYSILVFFYIGMHVGEALRDLLTRFRLPGEVGTTLVVSTSRFLLNFFSNQAQQIDRVMESFARQYHLSNPGRFSHEDTGYILSVAIIMLNTDGNFAVVVVA